MSFQQKKIQRPVALVMIAIIRPSFELLSIVEDERERLLRRSIHIWNHESCDTGARRCIHRHQPSVKTIIIMDFLWWKGLSPSTYGTGKVSRKCYWMGLLRLKPRRWCNHLRHSRISCGCIDSEDICVWIQHT